MSEIRNRKRSNQKSDVADNRYDEKVNVKQETAQKSIPKRVTIIDSTAIIFLFGSLITRLYKLGQPNGVVFDEIYFGQFVSNYLNRSFYFDSQPPLGKQIIALFAYLSGYNGDFHFEKIGASYENILPVYWMRFPVSISGALLVPAVYCLLRINQATRFCSTFAACLFLIENVFLTQSRFMLMEPFMLLFSIVGLCLITRATRHCPAPSSTWSVSWFLTILLGYFFLTAAVLVRYTGVVALLVGHYFVIAHFWSLLPDRQLSVSHLLRRLAVTLCVMFLFPLTIYVGCFYFHVSYLVNSGPNDSSMSWAFRLSLNGGLDTLIKDQPLEIGHGSQITLANSLEAGDCWLHSHELEYPIKYEDGRGSSHQQQVTCYPYKDPNNWWIIKLPDINDLTFNGTLRSISDGDVIQIVHGITGRVLNSHDVAGPVTPECQEVSCYIDYNVSMPAQSLWRLQLLNPGATFGKFHAITSQFRLVHVTTNTVLVVSDKQLPDWGYYQGEVVADRNHQAPKSIWKIEDHRYSSDGSSERHLREASMLPMVKDSTISVWDKIVELQLQMFSSNQESLRGHMYASEPFDWPILDRGVAYWISPSSNAQVYLIGNVVIWWSATVVIILYTLLCLFHLMRRRRNCYDICEAEWRRVCSLWQLTAIGFLFNYLPCFLVDHTFFLHHYLPAYTFAVMSVACFFDHLKHLAFRYHRCVGFLYCFYLLAWSLFAVYTFLEFSVFSYGTKPLNSNDINRLQWVSSWDFIIHRD